MELLWTSFINSYWRDWRGTGLPAEDRLDKPDWLAKFLAHWNLPIPPETTPDEIISLKSLRAELVGIARAMAQGEPITEVVSLNQLLQGGPVIRQLAQTSDGLKLTLTPAGQGWDQIRAEIVASLAQTLTEGEGSRVRICDNPDCLWVFYDDTRNRTKRFCDEKACGNLMKVRRFRARKKLETD